ncbi:CobW family GTP-binding protein [Reyranella sp.]|uniref:CobW family GTP-binding protein n=1 Tax=Reyranella sp. TaxID=1929291 RepID=UPI003BAC843B
MTSIPVTTIGGYLGAGKTTLLNGLLAGDHGLRIGVLVNDFGAISIDEKLIASRDEDIVTLANGCACCSVTGDLAMALDRFAGRADRYEQIVIEASGVADPARVAALAGSPGLSRGATVVVADAAAVRSRAHDKFVGSLVRRQLAAADILVLTKVDLANPTDLKDARAFATAQAPGARMIEVVQGRVDARDLFSQEPPRRGRLPACTSAMSDAASSLFESHHWSSGTPLDIEALRTVVAGLPDGIVRVKGILATTTGGGVALHRAGAIVSVDPLDGAPDTRGAEIVVIGRAGSLDTTQLDGAFGACLLQTRTDS